MTQECGVAGSFRQSREEGSDVVARETKQMIREDVGSRFSKKRKGVSWRLGW